MTNYFYNLDPQMVANMRPTAGEDTENIPLEPTDIKADQTAKAVLQSQTDHTKCWSCTKKVGLLGFKCRCAYTFCSKHRDADKHSCTFDYKKAHQEKLKKELQPCVKDKVENRIN